jgi:hypothetical protein
MDGREIIFDTRRQAPKGIRNISPAPYRPDERDNDPSFLADRGELHAPVPSIPAIATKFP